ncbi:MAG: hypothetical protein R3E57_05360 [Porticoccaceae bacterium]
MTQIVLKGCELENRGDRVRLTARVSGAESLWFEVDQQYAWMLDIESVDAFFILYVWLAMENGQNLVVEAPVSERLSNAVSGQIKKMFLVLCPRLLDVDIQIQQPCSEWSAMTQSSCATGFSGGVDSWYTALQASQTEHPFDYYIFANTGQHGLQRVDEVVLQRAAVAAQALATMNKPLIVVNTNIDTIFRERFQQRDVIGNISCVMALQRAISSYAYSSSYSPEESGVVQHYDMAIMDPILLPLLSTERTEFSSIGVGATRIEKLRYIVGKPGFSGKLYVCIEKDLPIKNCGYCFKCRRTQLALDSLDQMKLAGINFDAVSYRKRRKGLLIGLFASAKTNELDQEVTDELTRRYGVKMLCYRLFGSLWFVIQKCLPGGVRWRVEKRMPYLF